MNQERIQRNAIKAGVLASKRRHHLVSREELLRLKVQVMPMWPRVLICFAGLAMLAVAIWGGMDDATYRVLLGIGGAGTTSFSIFGVRRTLDSIEVGGDVLSVVLDAIGSVIDF